MTIREIRAAMGMKGVEFARLVGVSPGQLHDWENGRRRVPLERAAQIERLTGKTGLIAEVVRERTVA